MRKVAKKVYKQFTEWIEAQMQQRGIDVAVRTDQVRQEGSILIIPVHIRGILQKGVNGEARKEFVRAWDGYTIALNTDLDAFDRAVLLQDVEDAWNNQEPEPEPSLFLVPTAR